VQCVDAAERLLVDDLATDPELDQHVAECARCAHVARGVNRLDGVLTAALVVTPPPDLQRQLAQLALDAARPQTDSWWNRLLNGWMSLGQLLQVPRPQTVVLQGLASVMLALASWQIFGWLTTFQPVVGDIGYAMELVVASPAVIYLGGLQIDLQTLALWSLVGIGGWLISENGLIGRRLSNRLRLP
jgi:hypothetical protein